MLKKEMDEMQNRQDKLQEDLTDIKDMLHQLVKKRKKQQQSNDSDSDKD